jgi:uncharacterized protein (DUF697 family)
MITRSIESEASKGAMIPVSTLFQSVTNCPVFVGVIFAVLNFTCKSFNVKEQALYSALSISCIGFV